MRSQLAKRIGITVCLTMSFLFVALIARAQGGVSVPSTGLNNSATQTQATRQIEELQQQQLGDPRAAKAYDSFMKQKNPDKRIKQGKDFINRYPSDFRAQGVYEQLAQLYNAQHDMTDFYSCTDHGITLYPDDATLLSLSGFVIAHEYKPTDADGVKNLAKAETYEKRALNSISIMKAPRGMSDEQVAAYKKQVQGLAHGALGLIYFRQSKFQDSVTELHAATGFMASPDATDYLVLGADYQNLNEFKDAADAFNQCAKIAGPLQAGCKQYADQDSKQAAVTK
jgi:tetratricopeptide (TPR) repeat protein